MPIMPPQNPGSSDPRKQKQKGSGFTNLNKVIDANKGNQLGSAVAGSLQQTGQNIQQATANAADRFNQDLKQNAFGQEQAAQRDAIIGKAATGNVDDQDVAAISRFSSGTYQGPKTLRNQDELKNEAERANTLARGSNTEQGRYGLLQQFNPTSKYTQGTQRTDALLLGQDAKRIQAASGALRGLSRGVEQQIGQAEGAAKQAAAENQTFGTQTKNTLDTGITGISSEAEGVQKIAQERELAKSNAMTGAASALSAPDEKGLNNNNRRKEQISQIGSQLGLSKEDTDYMSSQYDALVNSGLSGPEAGAQIAKIMNLQQQGQDVLSDVSSFMSPEKAAQLKALQKLSGKEVGAYDKAGQYKESTADLKDKSSIEGLSRTRNEQNNLNKEAERLQHYITNSKAAQNSAIHNKNPGDREFFASQKPELRDIYAKLDKRYPGDKKERDRLIVQANKLQKEALDLAGSKVNETRQKASNYGNLNSVDAYKQYLNNLGKVGTF